MTTYTIDTSPPLSYMLFDMDGLLLDTEPVYTEVTQMIVGRYGKQFDWSVKANMIGRKAIDSAHYLVDTLSLPISAEDYLEERNQLLIERFPFCRVLPGVEKLINHLKHHQIPMAVATSSTKELFAIKTSKHKSLFKLFDVIVTGCDPEIGAGKPAPDIFLLAAKRLHCPHPEQCLVFEDAPSGLAAAKAANMTAVVVPDANMPSERYTEADLMLSSLTAFDPSHFGLPPYNSRS